MKEKKKILIADADGALQRKIKTSKWASSYECAFASQGFDCWEKIETFAPELIVVDLMLPKIHGMEILRRVKGAPRTEHMGVILTSFFSTGQNIHCAKINRADYFLAKPFDVAHLFSLIALFFKEKLHLEPFHDKKVRIRENDPPYHLKPLEHASYLKFWGTRGSNPVSGPDYVRFGGNTSCLEVRFGKDLIIFDAGTGIRSLGALFKEEAPKDIHIVLSHFHFDHLSGFPFFAPIYNPACTIHVWAPIGYEKLAREIFAEMLTYALFPVRLEDMKAKVLFKDIQEGVPFTVGPITINSHYAYHPGATLCFKIACGNRRFGYVTDNEFLLGFHGNPDRLSKKHRLLAPYQSLIAFFKGCDMMIHEAQYTPSEYQHKVGWGHSSVANAAFLLKLIDVPNWIITHHDPKHTDSDLFKKIQLHYEILHDLSVECTARLAFDGLVLPLEEKSSK